MEIKVNTKKIISIALIIVMLVSLASCSAEGKERDDSQIGKVVSETKDAITIIDQAGREVTVPKDIESIALCYRVVIRFLLNLDQGSKIKGIGKTEDFLVEVEPSLSECVDVGKGVADIEALAELKPDVFFHKASDPKTLDAVEKIGIPSVGIDVENPDDMKMAIEILGKVCGAEEKATELNAYYDNKMAEFKEMTSKLDKEQKKSALILGSSLGEVADGTMLQGKMIEYAGGVNVAESIDATELWPMAGVEQIFEWNPDYIFITNSESTNYTAEELLNKPEWQQLSAVKNKQVFEMPAKIDSWEFPGLVSILGTEYMMKTMYPDLVSDKKLQSDVDELYKLTYNKTFPRKTLGY